jgi:Leucine rich repeat
MSEENQRPPLRRRSSSRLSLSDRDIEDDSDASDEDNINEEERIEILHQLQVQSARKFLWDEDEDESHDDIAALGTSPRRNISHGSSSRFVLPSTIGASFVWNSQEEIDLEGHLGAKRHDIIETKKRAGFLDRIFLSRGRSDRLGLHSAYAKSTQPRNGLFQNICLCIQGFFMFVGGCLFGARHTKRNFCIFFILAALATGLFFAVRSDGSDASYLREPTSTLAPTSNPTKAPEPVVTLPVPQGIAVPTAAPKHNVIGISDGDSVVGTPQGETVIDTHIAAFKDFLKEEGIYDQDRFNDINSPQYKALHWIVKVDPERMPPSTETFVLQRYALATLFFALSGAELSHPGQSAPQTGWKDQTGWMTGAGYCSWYGVHCITGDGSFDNSHVISVNLTANGLQGQIPPEVRFLSSLDHLDLSQNEINETIPVELGSMTGLRTLFLRENKLTGSIPSEFGQLSSLKNLDLSGNDLKGQIPSEIGYCTELRALVTDMNPRITGHIPPLSRLADLEVLSFKHNTLDGTIPDWLYDLTNLRQVRFQRNALTGKVSPKLANLSNLRKFGFLSRGNILCELSHSHCCGPLIYHRIPSIVSKLFYRRIP